MGGTTAGAGVRTIGVEEELFLFDPTSREVAAAAPALLKEFHEHGDGRRRTGRAVEDLDRELFRHQLETQTDPETDLDAVLAQVVAARRTAGEAARAAGFRIGACGMVPSGGPVATVTADDRYRAMVEALARSPATAAPVRCTCIPPSPPPRRGSP